MNFSFVDRDATTSQGLWSDLLKICKSGDWLVCQQYTYRSSNHFKYGAEVCQVSNDSCFPDLISNYLIEFPLFLRQLHDNCPISQPLFHRHFTPDVTWDHVNTTHHWWCQFHNNNNKPQPLSLPLFPSPHVALYNHISLPLIRVRWYLTFLEEPGLESCRNWQHTTTHRPLYCRVCCSVH